MGINPVIIYLVEQKQITEIIQMKSGSETMKTRSDVDPFTKSVFALSFDFGFGSWCNNFLLSFFWCKWTRMMQKFMKQIQVKKILICYVDFLKREILNSILFSCSKSSE